MVRLAALIAALATAAVAGAAGPNTAKVVFVNADGLYAIGDDGSALTQLRKVECPPGVPPPCPDAKNASWSPNGQMIATVFGSQLILVDTHTGAQRVLPTGVDVNGASAPAWSPDSRRIAFLDLDLIDGLGTLSDLYTYDLDTGAVRRLTFGRQVTDPAWAPGSAIVISSIIDSRSELFVADPNGGGVRRVTTSDRGVVNRRPEWSPDGSKIAFFTLPTEGHGFLQVVGADGSRLRALSDMPVDWSFGHGPAWSPDGSRIVFSTSLNGRPAAVTGIVVGRDLYSIGVDGSGLRRLTESGERSFADRDPTWAADGSSIAFDSDDRDGSATTNVYTMNPDGTCEHRLGDVQGWRPDWQPLAGSVSAHRDCIDLALVVKTPATTGLVGEAFVTVLNNGTRPLSGVVLTSSGGAVTVLSATTGAGTCSAPRGTLSCLLGTLAPGAQVDVDARVESRVVSKAGAIALGGTINFASRAGEQEELLSNNGLQVAIGTGHCRTSTPGSGVIHGTVFDDTICGRSGNDVITGDEGSDVIRAGAGNDSIDVRDREVDRVDCGPGRDVVRADRDDRIAANCETVRRRK